MKRGASLSESWKITSVEHVEDEEVERDMVATLVWRKCNILSDVPRRKSGKITYWICKGWIPVDHSIYLYDEQHWLRPDSPPVPFLWALLRKGMDKCALSFMQAGAAPDYKKYRLASLLGAHNWVEEIDCFHTCISRAIGQECKRSLEFMLRNWKDIDPFDDCVRYNTFSGHPAAYCLERRWATGLRMILRSFPFTIDFLEELAYRHEGMTMECRDALLLHVTDSQHHHETMRCVAWLGLKHVIPGMWNDILPKIVVPMMQTLTIAQIEGDYDNQRLSPSNVDPNKIAKI